YPGRNSKLPPLTFTAVERESRGTGSRNSFLSSCARTASIREKLKTTNSGTAIFIVPPITPILHHSSTPTSFDPLLPQHGNRLNLQECSGRPEFSRLDERAGRIAGFKNIFAHVGKNLAPSSFGSVDGHRHDVVQRAAGFCENAAHVLPRRLHLSGKIPGRNQTAFFVHRPDSGEKHECAAFDLHCLRVGRLRHRDNHLRSCASAVTADDMTNKPIRITR